MFLWGAIGGTLPTLGKIAGGVGGSFEPPAISSVAGVLVALAIYAFIGAIIARAMGESEMKKALVAGIAAPAILTNLFNGATQGNIRLNDLNIIGSAFAQTATTNSQGMMSGTTSSDAVTTSDQGTFRTVNIDPTLSSGPNLGDTKIGLRIYVVGKDGKNQVWYSGHVGDLRGRTSVAVPTTVDAKIVFGGGPELTVPASYQDVTIGYDLKLKPSFSSSLFWALGSQKESSVEVKPYVVHQTGSSQKE
jgi:hypothetical protein